MKRKDKVFQKLMAVSLATAMVMGVTGCAKTDSPSTPDNGNADVTTPTDTPTTPADDVDNSNADPVEQYTTLKDENGNVYDLGGIEVEVIDWWSDPDAKGEGEYAEAQAEYRDWLQETYNFKLVVKSCEGGWGEVANNFIAYATAPADDHNYMFLLRPGTDDGLINQNLFYDLSTIDCLDFSSEKFTINNVHEMFSRDGGIYAMAAGKAEPRLGMYFNKRLVEEAGYTADQIYDWQASGEWTWSKWEEIMAAVQVDRDGNGEPDAYGFDANHGDALNVVVFSNGGSPMILGSDGKYQVNVESDNTKRAIEWFMEMVEKYNAPLEEGHSDENGNAWDSYKDAWTAGHIAFMPENVYAAKNDGSQFVVNCEDDFGFVIFPKGESADACYATNLSENFCVIPSNYNGDPDRAWKIAFAWNVWNDPVPGYEDYDARKLEYQSSTYAFYSKGAERAMEETYDIMMKSMKANIASLLPKVDYGPDYSWKFGRGVAVNDVAGRLEETAAKWNEYIKEFYGE